MTDPKHLAKIKEGMLVWNQWREENRELLPRNSADLSGADLSGADLGRADLNNADLSKAKLSRADLSRADLSRADLSSANLRGADLRGADLSEADLSGANLSTADLSTAYLSRANLSWANLSGANLSRADLGGAALSEANLSMANLLGAKLTGANLTGTYLSKADLSGVDLRGAALSRADLNLANIAAAIVGETILDGNDLSTAKGLDTVKHEFPSPIGVSTIYLSQGKIPDSFLRGAGFPDELIDFFRHVFTNPVEFYSCFISHSTKDQDFAQRLHTDLQAKGVRCWFAPHDVQGGKKLYDQIDNAIRVYDRLLLILSPASIDSAWVKTEIAKARRRELCEKRQMLFPIRLVDFETLRDWECFDADAGTDSAREIREYFIPDFSNWKDHDSYQQAFDSLIRDLKGKAKAQSAG
jgi:uncharacterized protein YjbI with pentapeptide repeats